MNRIKFIDVNRPVMSCSDRFLFDMIASVCDGVVLDDDNPEVVFDLGFGFEYVNSKYESCIKVAICGENMVPDFSWFDYVIDFDYISFGDRYLRYPLFARCDGFDRLQQWTPVEDDDELLNRGFCSFVVSNSKCADPFREKFFKRLSQYKRIDSGGRYLNNVGGPVSDKFSFCAKYKFNLAFENSAHPGYVTEKLLEPLSVNSVPIYFGDPLVHNEFEPGCMIRVSNEAEMESVIERIVALDKDDKSYLEVCRSRRFVDEDVGKYNRNLAEFLRKIMQQDVITAKRALNYGYHLLVRNDLREKMSSIPTQLSRKMLRAASRLLGR